MCMDHLSISMVDPSPFIIARFITCWACAIFEDWPFLTYNV